MFDNVFYHVISVIVNNITINNIKTGITFDVKTNTYYLVKSANLPYTKQNENSVISYKCY